MLEHNALGMNHVPTVAQGTILPAIQMGRGIASDAVDLSQRLAVTLQQQVAVLLVFSKDGSLSKVDMKTLASGASLPKTADTGVTK